MRHSERDSFTPTPGRAPALCARLHQCIVLQRFGRVNALRRFSVPFSTLPHTRRLRLVLPPSTPRIPVGQIRQDRPPRFRFEPQALSGMRRTRGGQRQTRHMDASVPITPVKTLRALAVEKDLLDSPTATQQRGDIVGNRIANGRILSALAAAGLQHIPERDPVLAQKIDSAGIVPRFRLGENCGNNPPKMIARVPIVLPALQRHGSGHRTQDQDTRALIGHRSEALKNRHPARFHLKRRIGRPISATTSLPTWLRDEGRTSPGLAAAKATVTRARIACP